MEDPSKFDVRQHLNSKRKHEYESCFDLLWENLEAGKWNQMGRISGQKLTDQEKIEKQINHYFPILAQFYIVFSHSIDFIEEVGAKQALLYGGARRIGSIRSAVERIVDTAPPSRTKRLERIEQTDITDALLLLYVHMIGVLGSGLIART